MRPSAVACVIMMAWAVATAALPGRGVRAEVLSGGGAAGLPDLVRTKHRTFSIPFRLPAPQDADAAPERVVMSVSKDLGITWETAGEVAPAAGTFTYRAVADGEYWFRLRSVDRKGRTRGGAGPDMRVLVDAAGPRLAARVWKGSDGEILCRYAAVDDSIRLEALKLEYRTAGDQQWKSVAAQGVLSRESPAHLVGEEIWWAGEKVEQLTVRITVSDAAGNQTTRQFTMEAADPRVDQAALAQELGVPGLPAAPATPDDDGRVVSHASPAADPARSPAGPRSPAGWTAEPAAAWAAEQPRLPAGPTDRPGEAPSVLVRAPGAAPALDPTRNRSLLTATGAAWPSTAGAGQSGLEYRGKPLQLSRSRRFAWDYEVPAERPGKGPVRVELWSTRDGGLSWQKTAVDDDSVSPINVMLPSAGLYGFRLEMVPDGPEAGTGPRPGDVAESWIGIDDEAPHVELLEANRIAAGEGAGVVIRYTSRDQLPAPKTTRILFSPNAEGPWATVVGGIDNQGEYRWQPDRATPARVYVRIEVTDAAGNVGSATSAEPVTVTSSRIVGRLGGLRSLPPAP